MSLLATAQLSQIGNTAVTWAQPEVVLSDNNTRLSSEENALYLASYSDGYTSELRSLNKILRIDEVSTSNKN